MTSVKLVKLVPFVNRVTRLARHARTHGKARTCYSLSQALLGLPVLRSCLRFGAVEVFRVSLAEWQSASRIPRAFTVRQAEPDDVPALARYFGDRKRVQSRFERGDLCFLTLSGEQIGAAVWLAEGPNDYREDWDELACVFQFPNGTGWCFDGKGTKWGAWGSLMARLREFLDQREIQEVFTLIGCNNWQSIDSHKSLGYKSVGLISCFGAMGRSQAVFRRHGQPWRKFPGNLGNLRLLANAARRPD